ncbi:hypothetical protein [Psychromarinibacter sp. S121]|uniref:LIC10280 family protein n=1 Tax=Psychromarinibacter sp. S121 TaxID=3415127 RepID=UPI003C7C8715
MTTRRLFTAGLIVLAALPAFAQEGKKGSGPNTAPALIEIAGTYSSRGLNADGTEYMGRAQIVQQGEAVEFTWFVGNDTFRGRGAIDGRLVAVDWGAESPVVYVVMPDGELHGTWDDGRALEKLTPN